jgi:GntR family transcriptional regulator
MGKEQSFPTLYQKVQQRLREEIASGRLKEGDLIPSEVELGRKYGVSQGTVRKAILDLTHRGIFYRKQGKGTFVVFDKSSRARQRNFRFVTGMDSEMVSVNLGFVKIQVIPARDGVAANLGMKNGAQVIRLERLGKISDQVMIVTNSYLPRHLYKGLENYTAEDFFKNTLWKLQEIYFGIRAMKREELISAVSADKTTAGLLEVKPGTPLLRIEMRLTSYKDTIVEYRDSYCQTGAFRFFTELRGT